MADLAPITQAADSADQKSSWRFWINFISIVARFADAQMEMYRNGATAQPLRRVPEDFARIFCGKSGPLI